MTENSFHARLARITYEDTSGDNDTLTRYGFIIEAEEAVAERLAALQLEVPQAPPSSIDEESALRLALYQFLIGNTDWSFIRGAGQDVCCHNVHLIEKNGGLFPIPYDFDISGLVNASYAKPNSIVGTKRVTQRVYRGYCKLPIDRVAPALEKITALREPIMLLVEESPVAGDEDTDSRVRYIGHFFKDAENAAKLLKQFDADCVGPR